MENTSDQLECESNGTEDAEEGFTRILMNEWALDGNIALEREREREEEKCHGVKVKDFRNGLSSSMIFHTPTPLRIHPVRKHKIRPWNL